MGFTNWIHITRYFLKQHYCINAVVIFVWHYCIISVFQHGTCPICRHRIDVRLPPADILPDWTAFLWHSSKAPPQTFSSFDLNESCFCFLCHISSSNLCSSKVNFFCPVTACCCFMCNNLKVFVAWRKQVVRTSCMNKIKIVHKRRSFVIL